MFQWGSYPKKVPLTTCAPFNRMETFLPIFRDNMSKGRWVGVILVQHYLLFTSLTGSLSLLQLGVLLHKGFSFERKFTIFII